MLSRTARKYHLQSAETVMLLATQWQSMFGLQGMSANLGAISIVVQRVIVIGDEPCPSSNRCARCENPVQHLPNGSLKKSSRTWFGTPVVRSIIPRVSLKSAGTDPEGPVGLAGFTLVIVPSTQPRLQETTCHCYTLSILKDLIQ